MNELQNTNNVPPPRVKVGLELNGKAWLRVMCKIMRLRTMNDEGCWGLTSKSKLLNFSVFYSEDDYIVENV